MRSAAVLVILVATVSACTGQQGSKFAAAAIGAGAAVAVAAINRAATGECWASCPAGEECDHKSGTCVPLPCRDACPGDSLCVMVEGRETCVRRGQRDTATTEISPASEGEIPGDAKPASEPDPCRGLCFRSERCAVDKNGVADCVIR